MRYYFLIYPYISLLLIQFFFFITFQRSFFFIVDESWVVEVIDDNRGEKREYLIAQRYVMIREVRSFLQYVRRSYLTCDEQFSRGISVARLAVDTKLTFLEFIYFDLAPFINVIK